MSDISKSPLGEKFDAEFEKKVAACTNTAQLSELFKNRSVETGLAVREWDNSILTPTALAYAPQPQKFAQTVIIDGTKHVVERDSELECQRAVNDLVRENLQPTPATEPLQSRNDKGQFVTDDDAAKVDAVLRSHGVSLADLKDVSAQKFATSWASATEEFKNSAAGKDWPGGAENLRLMGEILVEKNLADHPSVESLTEAYETLKRENRLVSTPESEFYERARNAKSFSELTELTSELTSSLFGRR